MKKALSLILALVLCLGLAVPALALDYGQEYAGYNPTPGQQYKDVPATHWAFKNINTCSERTWFNGYPDGTFRPEGLITREEAAKVFAVALDLTLDDNPTPSFTDTAGIWSTAFIEATKVLFPNTQNLQGTTSFRPTKTITREETVYALVVAWKLASKVKNVDMSILNMFSDQQTISAAVKPYIAVAVNEKLVSGLPDGTFGGQKGLSRAEFAALLARALDHGYGADDTSAPQITLDRYSATTSKETITLTGKVEPMMVGTTLKVGTQKIALAGDGLFSVTLDLNEGANSFTFTATNAYDNSSTKAASVTRSPASVSVRVLSRVPETTNVESLDINGVIDNFSADCTLTVNERVVSVESDGHFSTTVTLDEGRNVIELIVLRQQQEVGSKTVRLTYEKPASPDEQNNGGSSGGNTIIVNGSVVIGNENNVDSNNNNNNNSGNGSDNTLLNPLTPIQPRPTEPTMEYCQLNVTSMALNVGETGTVRVTGTYSDGSTKDVTSISGMVSSDTSVATVSADGTVRAIKAGTARISMGRAPGTVAGGTAVALTVSRGVIDSGTCGRNVNWTLYADGELAITGRGAMRDYDSTDELPWHSYRTEIQTATISDGITSVGDLAFGGCGYLENVAIGSDVTRIGWGAFAGCSLTGIDIPYGVTEIVDNAFYECEELTDMFIPDSVVSIGERAFYETSLTGILEIPEGVRDIGTEAFGFTDITELWIPSSVTSIGSDVCFGCAELTKICVDYSNPEYASSDGVLFSEDGYILKQYPCGRRDSYYAIPTGVGQIGTYAFSVCDYLTTVTIPSTVCSIEDDAFFWCENLTDVYYEGTGDQWDTLTDSSWYEWSGTPVTTIHCDWGLTGPRWL